MGRGEYILSDDPRDFEQFGTMEYRGRPFLVVTNEPKRRGPPPSAQRLCARMIFVNSAAPLAIGDLARQLGIARIDANTLAQTMLKAGENPAPCSWHLFVGGQGEGGMTPPVQEHAARPQGTLHGLGRARVETPHLKPPPVSSINA